MFFRQLFESKSSTYTYLLGCRKTGKAALIDPVLETVERDFKLIKELGFDLIYGINTHLHADHITGTGLMKRIFPKMKSVLSSFAGGDADWKIDEGDVINIGDNIQLETLATPGHTDGCLTYVLHKGRCLFTGDALLIRGCGRTDFQNGSSSLLYKSVHKKLFTLPDDYTVYPAHDYHGALCSTIGEEKKFNPRMTLDEADFIECMENLNLPYPKEIEHALPSNKHCGLYALNKNPM